MQLQNTQPRSSRVATMPDDALAPIAQPTARPAAPRPRTHDEALHGDTEKDESDIANVHAVIKAGIVTATTTNIPQGTLISVPVSIMDGTSFLLQQRLLELSGHAITGTVQSTMRLPDGEVINLRNDVRGNLMVRFRKHVLGDGGPALQPIDSYDPPHPDNVKLQSDNGCETTIVPVELRNLLYLPSSVPGTGIRGSVAGSSQLSCGSGILRFLTPPAPAVVNALTAACHRVLTHELTRPETDDHLANRTVGAK